MALRIIGRSGLEAEYRRPQRGPPLRTGRSGMPSTRGWLKSAPACSSRPGAKKWTYGLVNRREGDDAFESTLKRMADAVCGLLADAVRRCICTALRFRTISGPAGAIWTFSFSPGTPSRRRRGKACRAAADRCSGPEAGAYRIPLVRGRNAAAAGLPHGRTGPCRLLGNDRPAPDGRLSARRVRPLAAPKTGAASGGRRPARGNVEKQRKRCRSRSAAKRKINAEPK